MALIASKSGSWHLGRKQGKTDLDEGEELAHAKILWLKGVWLIQGAQERSKCVEGRG